MMTTIIIEDVDADGDDDDDDVGEGDDDGDDDDDDDGDGDDHGDGDGDGEHALSAHGCPVRPHEVMWHPPLELEPGEGKEEVMVKVEVGVRLKAGLGTRRSSSDPHDLRDRHKA